MDRKFLLELSLKLTAAKLSLELALENLQAAGQLAHSIRALAKPFTQTSFLKKVSRAQTNRSFGKVTIRAAI